ncbi:MAG: IS1182 family transposase [Deltaproteobacteria bacterium]|nr:MAG: IS1182 family transposase [Deltaproteobacteria bacterium]
MARYKEYDYRQGKFIPISFDKQILPGTFEHTLNYLIDNELDLSIFNDRYSNDATGAPAYDPAILLKIILYAYSRGITSSRRIEQCCQENVIFMALSCDTHPHFTTIADFISTLDKEIVKLFLEVLLVCDHMNLIGKEMFALDGVKLPSNVSKEWSGTKEELTKKKEKMEKIIQQMVARHKEADTENLPREDEKYIATLTENVKKIRSFLASHDDKPGKKGPIKSNVTDNDSAKMKTSKGVIQGYDGVAMVDAKHQVIVHAEAFGAPQEQGLLLPMIEGAKENFKTLGDPDVFEEAKLTADSGFHSEKNVEMLSEKQIDAYVADNQMRKRDPLFSQRDRYKERFRKEHAAYFGTTTAFTVRQFTMAEDKSHCICPAGKRLYRNGGNIIMRGNKATKFRGSKRDCLPCELRKKCLRYPDRTETRQVYFFEGRKGSFTEMMKKKIDSLRGRLIYNRRLATVEPVFAHIRSALGLDRFTLRGKKKVNIQWLLYCTVHNLLKVHRYGYGYA